MLLNVVNSLSLKKTCWVCNDLVNFFMINWYVECVKMFIYSQATAGLLTIITIYINFKHVVYSASNKLHGFLRNIIID